MKKAPTPRLAGLLAAALLLSATSPSVRASDHADPMSINVLKARRMAEANITDLHAFVVDASGKRIEDASRMNEAERLIVSLCVRAALQPQQIGALKLDGYKYRLHIDFDPEVRFFNEKETPEGADYAKTLAGINARIEELGKALEEAKKKGPAEQAQAQAALTAALATRGGLIGQHQRDRSMQALYGGILPHPDNIAENATLQYELELTGSGETAEAKVRNYQIDGIPGSTNLVATGGPLAPGVINVQAGVFDDPFIFPRFFRRNIVGVVTSIPLALLPEATRRAPILLWVTTHRGGQIDHVGRSLRTQLPRFGYLNDKHPSNHVRAITQVHDHPLIMENLFATFVSPLFAHRHYDSVPDVMLYDLSKPAKFPNGRGYPDDVAAALAAAGETLLVELSYAESKQFPRATTNDKPFRDDFPYMAPRWTMAEVAAHAQPGTRIGNLEVPMAADSAAIAAPTFTNQTWRTLWLLEVALIIGLAAFLFAALRSSGLRWALVLLTIIVLCFLSFVSMPNGTADVFQAEKKLCRLIWGGLYIALLTLSLLFVWGRRSCRKWPIEEEKFPLGDQGLTGDDLTPSSYDEIKDALFNPKVNGQYYSVWGVAGQNALPIYKVTVASLTKGLWRFWTEFPMLKAARRTVRSQADLRWGRDRKGFRRLVHPMGICLEGTWKIDADSPLKEYTGYFAPGKVGRVIARYSLGGNDPRNGRNRSLGLVGKIFPMQDQGRGTPRANFITQEDLGGAYTDSIKEAIMTNSPPVTLLKRGSGIFGFLVVIIALMRTDKQPSERQLYEVAELEVPKGTRTNCPRFMKLQVEGEDLPVGGSDADFRDEILARMYDRGETAPKRPLNFGIYVSDKGERTLLQKVYGQEWTRIGTLSFQTAVASHNGDFVVHFHHPLWRIDRNDSATVATPQK